MSKNVQDIKYPALEDGCSTNLPLMVYFSHMSLPAWIGDAVLLVSFIAVQIIAVVAFFAIRYHFRLFALPGEVRAVKRVLALCGLGIIVGCVVSGILILGALNR